MKIINCGKCGCWYDCVVLDFGFDGCVGISVFCVEVCSLFYICDLLEWYFEGLQVFIFMSFDFFLIIVVLDEGGLFGWLCVFVSNVG